MEEQTKPSEKMIAAMAEKIIASKSREELEQLVVAVMSRQELEDYVYDCLYRTMQYSEAEFWANVEQYGLDIEALTDK